MATAAKTKAALEKIVNAKISAARPTAIVGEVAVATKEKYINYTPSDAAPGKLAGKQRIIRMVEMAVDPLEPPKFKHKKVPGGPGSPPVPIMHSPPRKLTVQDQQAWKIPPVVSNWKNAKARADYRPLFSLHPERTTMACRVTRSRWTSVWQQTAGPCSRPPSTTRYAVLTTLLCCLCVAEESSVALPQFATLSEALYVAERKARAEVEMRAEMQKRMIAKEKEQQVGSRARYHMRVCTYHIVYPLHSHPHICTHVRCSTC